MSKPFSCPDCSKSFRKEVGLSDHRRDVHAHADLVAGPVCLECGGEGVLVTGERIYPHRPDLFAKQLYLCSCGAYCGCHPGTIKPLGHPCGAETRKARSAAHAAFDPIWKHQGVSRASAYAWLAEQTGIAPGDCHIGMMSAEQARKVVMACHAREAS